MAFSINNALSSPCSSVNNCLEGKKSLFLLKNITALTNLGCESLSKNDWQRTVGDVIDSYVNSLHKDPDSIKKELTGLKLVRPSLASYSLKEIFNAALSESIGIDKNSQLLSSLAKDQEIHQINQVYTEQFLTWIQVEIEKLPIFSILLLLNIYHGFSDPSIGLHKNTWQELLSLNGWNESQKKSLNQFKSKYELLTNFNSLKFPVIKLENTINTLEPLGDIKKLKDQCLLWSRLVELLAENLDEKQEKQFARSLDKNKKLLREEGKISDKEFIVNYKKLVTSFLPKLEQAKKDYDKEISESSATLKFIQGVLKDEDDKLQGLQNRLKEVQENLEVLADSVQKAQKDKDQLSETKLYIEGILDHFPPTEEGQVILQKRQEVLQKIKEYDQTLQNACKAREKVMEDSQRGNSFISIIESGKKDLQLVEKDKKDIDNNFLLRKESLLSMESLSKWLINLLEKERQSIEGLEQETRIAYEASMKKSEVLSKKLLTKFSKQCLVEEVSIEAKDISKEDSEEEFSASSSSEALKPIPSKIDSFNEINMYLKQLKSGESTQLNGFFSQTVDGFLKKLKSHLLQVKVAPDLKALYELQTKEIYDHLLIGVAGLELIAQAIRDQRPDRIALGLRVVLMHCGYAAEQGLSQLLLKTNKLDKADEVHDLIHLAKKAKIAEIKKWELFLKEISLHLTFSYPEDYRLFFQQGNNSKAFSLFDDLSRPNLDKKKVKEAVQFCFEMYSKTIAFITEISSAQIEEQPKLLQAIQEMKEQIVEIDNPPAKKIPFTKSVQLVNESDQALGKKVDQVLEALGPLNVYSHLPDRRIYAAIGTIKNYLQLMKISLEIPQDSSKHSLQKFIKVETITNIDKLFKHLFRAVILLKSGEDNHQHTLTNLFASTTDFYRKENEQAINYHLKRINLGISHHYLHIKENNSELHSIYKNLLDQACSLVSISDEYAIIHKKGKKSTKELQKNINRISELVSSSLDLFMEFLGPTLAEIKERISIPAVA